MNPTDILKVAEGIKFQDRDGDVDELKLLPPLNDAELRHLESRLPCPLPEEARQLLLYCRGFDRVLESIDFSGSLTAGFGMEAIFPHALPIAHDGFGNYWIVYLTKESRTWGPIFFAYQIRPSLWQRLFK